MTRSKAKFEKRPLFQDDLGNPVLVWDIDQTLQHLRVGRSTLYRAMQNGEIKYVKILGRTMFRPKDVVKFINRRKVAA